MRRDFESVSSSIRVQDLVGINAQVAKGIDGDQDMANVGVDFAMLKPFLQVVVDGFIGDLAQQGEI